MDVKLLLNRKLVKELERAKKLRELFEENDNFKLVLPDFQRALEWKVEDQKKLLASILVSLPIGSLLILSGNKDAFAAKKLCYPTETVHPTEECLYLLDGQQRISSLKSIFSNFYIDKTQWKNHFDKIYSDLRYRWFVRVKPNNDEDDVFGWKNLHFLGLKTFEPTQIQSLIETKRIYKTKDQEWYNPGYSPVDQNNQILGESATRNHIAKLSAQEGLVPLYTVYSPGSLGALLHETVLIKIASSRVENLKDKIADGELNITDVLGFLESDVANIVDEDTLTELWSSLGAKWAQSVLSALNQVIEEEIPVIVLPSNEVNRAVSIFESINRGGTPLDTYDLIVARSARDGSLSGSLTDRIVQILESPIELQPALDLNVPASWNSNNFGTLQEHSITKVIKEQYLNLLSIFSYTDYGDIVNIKLDLIKRNKILDLTFNQINNNTAVTIQSLNRAFAFLQIRCGVLNIDLLPYKLMILPLAYCLRDDNIWNKTSNLNKLEYWYWTSLFGGAYRASQNNQCIEDIKELYAWLNSGVNQFAKIYNKILKDPGYSDLDTLLMNNESIPLAISRGILQYTLSRQPTDFIPNNLLQLKLVSWDIASNRTHVYKGEKVCIKLEDHHICPLGNYTKIDESSNALRKQKDHKLNSPLNRTYISHIANRLIRDKSPLNYLAYVETLGLYGHCIPTPFIQRYSLAPNETEAEFHIRILTERYNILLRDIILELDLLSV